MSNSGAASAVQGGPAAASAARCQLLQNSHPSSSPSTSLLLPRPSPPLSLLQYATRVSTIKNDVSKHENSAEVLRLKRQIDHWKEQAGLPPHKRDYVDLEEIQGGWVGVACVQGCGGGWAGGCLLVGMQGDFY